MENIKIYGLYIFSLIAPSLTNVSEGLQAVSYLFLIVYTGIQIWQKLKN
jgi:hypothetical protein